jgi:hypothetical protein
MQILMKAMDYIFYRTARFFFQKDGSSAHRALILLSAFQSLLIIEIITVIIFSFYKRNELYQFTVVAKFIGVAICITVFFLNMRKYKGKYFRFRDMWINEDLKVKQLRGVFLVVTLIIPWIVMIILGIR